jgi:hypothetical protein
MFLFFFIFLFYLFIYFFLNKRLLNVNFRATLLDILALSLPPKAVAIASFGRGVSV